MSIKSRLERLEKQMRSADHNIVIFDEKLSFVDAEILRLPTPEAEGLAELPDGSQMPILYEYGWNDGARYGGIAGIMEDYPGPFPLPIGDDVPPIPEGATAEGKLRIRLGNKAFLWMV